MTGSGSWPAPIPEAAGWFAEEVAADERAARAGVDPVELRLRAGPHECLRTGADRFGWATRRQGPTGKDLYGTGVATSPHGAQFVEVRVDVDTAEVYVTRMLGVFAHVDDPLRARSRYTAAMIHGLATALHEGGADVPPVDIVLLDGEVLGSDLPHAASAAAAAVVNAVADATGCRLRDLPIHPAALLAATEPYASASI